MAITVNGFRDNVVGSYRERYYNIDVGVTGDTLDTGYHAILAVSTSNPAGITNVSESTAGVLQFTGTGTGVYVRVAGV